MKRWKLILVSVIIILVFIFVSAFSIFHFYIVPRYIEPMLKTAADILNDEEIQTEISQAAKEFAQKGLIDEKLVEDYADNLQKSKSDTQQTDDAGQSSDVTDTDADSSQSVESVNAQNSVGAKNVKVQDGEEKRYTYGNSGKNSAETKTPDADMGKLSNSEQKLYDRVKSEVSSKDMSRGYELLAKLDMGQVRSLLSNRAELKKYIKSVLSEAEYSEAIELYLKYAYLLQ